MAPAILQVDDADDAHSAKRWPATVSALPERALISMTVLLELEWVRRGFDEPPPKDIARVWRALAQRVEWLI